MNPDIRELLSKLREMIDPTTLADGEQWTTDYVKTMQANIDAALSAPPAPVNAEGLGEEGTEAGYTRAAGPDEYPDDCGRMRGKPWVVCAALRHKDGRIVTGARHWCPTMQRQIGLDNFKSWADSEQGFVDQHGHFLTRKEAATLAAKNRQTVDDLSGTILTSEDLY